MLIYEKDGYQVVQHPHLQYFYVKEWMVGDCLRSYNEVWDYFTIKTCNSIEEVNTWFKEKVWVKS